MMFSNFSNSCLNFRDRFDSYGGFGNMMGGFGIFGVILMLLFWLGLIALVVALVVWLIRRASRGPSTLSHPGSMYPPAAGSGTSFHESDTASALRILNERYARGEITEEEYLKIKKNLG